MIRSRQLFFLAAFALGLIASAWAREEIAFRDLPSEAKETLAHIRAGGPFPYRRDGVVFHNLERRLPERPSGHYREYTVPTPGEKTRGARRIVCAGEDPRRPEVCYYTSDHYQSFRKIVE